MSQNMCSPKRNILLVIADDLGKYIGCYGCTSVKTPNMDRLASQGVRFDMAFASTASCSGSRSTIYTGLHTHQNGQYGLNIFRTHFQTFSHIETLPSLFNGLGYLTGILGKVHVGPDEVYPWTVRQESESRDVAWIADEAEHFFAGAKEKGQPFCLTVGYVDPHRDVGSRGGFGNGIFHDERISDLAIGLDDVEVPSWLSDIPEVRRELVEYYKAIWRTDQGLGLLLEALKRQGLEDDTLVVFTSDNGPPFLNAKTTLYDAGTCLPLIVRQPGGPSNIANKNMISWIDFLPTFLDWAGAPESNGKDTNGNGYIKPGSGCARTAARSPARSGRSFLKILGEESRLPITEWQHHIFGSHTFHELQNYWPTRVLRTPRYKYHRNIAHQLPFPFATDLYASNSWEGMRNVSPPSIGNRTLAKYLQRPPEELFDLERDPDELTNLATDPEHASILSKLRFQLEKWQQETQDLWLYRDGCSLLHLANYSDGGLVVPDRFDLDIEHPGTGHVRLLDVGAPVKALKSSV